MSKSICQKYIHYRIRKLQNKTRNKCFVNLEQAKTIHLLVGAESLTPMQSEQFYQQVYELAALCQRKKLNAHITVCVKKIPLEAKRFNITVFDYKQVKIFSKLPKNHIIEAFQQIKPQVLINLTPFVCAPLEYLAAGSDASLKVAIKVPGRPFEYDFQLSVDNAENNLLQNVEAIFFYLQKIQSK